MNEAVVKFVQEQCVRGDAKVSLQSLMKAFSASFPQAFINQRTFAQNFLLCCPAPKPQYKRGTIGMTFLGLGLASEQAQAGATKKHRTDDERKLARALAKRRYYEKKRQEMGKTPGKPRGPHHEVVIPASAPEPALPLEPEPVTPTATMPDLPATGLITRDQYRQVADCYFVEELNVTDPVTLQKLEDEHAAKLKALQSRLPQEEQVSV